MTQQAKEAIPRIPRCRWCNMRNPLCVEYHDQQWGVPCHEDGELYELLLLESFQAGLSWETILNKRESFRRAYDGFHVDTVCTFDREKKDELLGNKGIIRNRLKIEASVKNSLVFREIQSKFGSFDAYIWGFTNGQVLVESDPAVTKSELSDRISADLKKRGMSFVGSTIIYAYLQAIGVVNAHERGCYLCPAEKNQTTQAVEE